MKRVLLRSEILSKIRLCDGKLSHALQMFQVCLQSCAFVFTFLAKRLRTQTKLSLRTHLVSQAPKVHGHYDARPEHRKTDLIDRSRPHWTVL
jgi:hypothetical protein